MSQEQSQEICILTKSLPLPSQNCFGGDVEFGLTSSIQALQEMESEQSSGSQSKPITNTEGINRIIQISHQVFCFTI
jgi:hypothetical protein